MMSEGHDYESEEASLVWLAPLRDPFGLLRRQKWWMVISLILLLAAAAAVTQLMPLKFESRATIRLTAKSIPDEYVPTTILSNILEQFEAIRSEVYSRDRLTQIILDTGLYLEERETVLMSSLASRLSEELVVSPLGRTRSRGAPNSVAFEVTMSGGDPALITNVVNTAVSELINANIEYRSRQARVTTDFMRREYERADAELREHQRELADFRETHRGALPEERVTALAKLERLEEQRRSSILQVSDLRSRLAQLAAMPVERRTRDSIAAIDQQLETAKTLYTDDHPTVRSLERRRALLLEQQVGAASSGVTSADPLFSEQATITADIRLQELRLSQIDEDVAAIEMLLASAPKVAEDYAALVRREQILQENYVEYLRKLKDAELALSLESSQQGAQLSRLDPAIVPTQPTIPRWMVAAAGIAVSILAALAIGVGRELLFPVVVDEAHLDALCAPDCIGSISRVA